MILRYCNPEAPECVIIHSMSVLIMDSGRSPAREQIEGAAPDHATRRAADELARGDNWQHAGCRRIEQSSARLLWAEFPDGKRAPARATVQLPTMRVACTCAATRFPCRHILGLLLRDQADALEDRPPPDWALHSLAARPGRAETSIDPHDHRREKLVAGMADLQRWLGDVAQQGLAGLPQRRRPEWLAAADRLVDAYAPEAARELRELSLLPGSAPDWPEKLLARLGRLALLCAAFERLDALSPGERADALAAAGQPPRSGDDCVTDRWLVVGARHEYENKQRRERVWLFGQTSGRWALLSDTRPTNRLEGVCLPAGVTMSGEVAFAPSAWPLVVRPTTELTLAAPAGSDIVRGGNVSDVLAGYAAALAANPWLRRFPALVDEAFIEPPAAGLPLWRLRDRRGHILPLPPRFLYGWHLLALAADRPLTLCGEWDSACFAPLSVWRDGWRALAAWRGVS